MKYSEIIAWVQYSKVEPQNGSNVLQFPYKKHSLSEVSFHWSMEYRYSYLLLQKRKTNIQSFIISGTHHSTHQQPDLMSGGVP